MRQRTRWNVVTLGVVLLPGLALVQGAPASADEHEPVGVCAPGPPPPPPAPPSPPCMVADTGLGTAPYAGGFTTPIGIAFPSADEQWVIEKNTGRVLRVDDGEVDDDPLLDLAVNHASERGLLGIALHPDFGVADCSAVPTPLSCSVYLNWVESTTREDTAALWQVPLMGHRLDRFLYDGEELEHHSTIQRFRAYQKDYNQSPSSELAAPTAPPVLAASRGGQLPPTTQTLGYTYYTDTRVDLGLGAVAQHETRLSPLADIRPGVRGAQVTLTVPTPAGRARPTGVRVYLKGGLDPAGQPEMLRVAQVPFAEAGGDLSVTVGAPPDPSTGQSPPPYLLRGNHNGGVTRFGTDRKLYVYQGDAGRRGWTQNLPDGPATPDDPNEICADSGLAPTCDDQFGGPLPDDEHLTGVVLRLNPDGTAPRDNPLWAAGEQFSGEVRENLRKIWTYGHRNGFGMDVDPIRGRMWAQENGDDTFSEVNYLSPGRNSGWVQVMGPTSRVEEYRSNEIAFGPGLLQQLRWPPSTIATTEEEALERLVLPPGAEYHDPEFTWRWEVAPGGIGFARAELGEEYEGDLFLGSATPRLHGGYLMRFELAGFERDRFELDGPREDRVADNTAKHDPTESEPLIVGRGFGSTPDVQPGPDGALWVVSLTQGTVHRVFAQEG